MPTIAFPNLVLTLTSLLLVACPGSSTSDDEPGGSGGGGESTVGGNGAGAAGGGAAGGGAAGGGAAGGGAAGGGAAGADSCDADPHGSNDQPDVVEPIAGVSVTTVAGSEYAGDNDGFGIDARFNNPVNLVFLTGGVLAIADFDNGTIRSLTVDGSVATLSQGNGMARPFGLAVSADGVLAVGTDYDQQGEDAGFGGGVIWLVDATTGEAVALATGAGRPRGIGYLPSGMLAVADLAAAELRLVDPVSGDAVPLAGKPGCEAFADGAATAARFNRPYGVVVTPEGDLLVADQRNHRIRRVTEAGVVSTFAGDGTPDMVDGDLSTARFNLPQALALDALGNLYVSDVGNHRIRRIDVDGTVKTVAGDGEAGFRDGPGNEARFFGQEGLAVSPEGNALYVADGTNGEPGPYHRVRRIDIP